MTDINLHFLVLITYPRVQATERHLDKSVFWDQLSHINVAVSPHPTPYISSHFHTHTPLVWFQQNETTHNTDSKDHKTTSDGGWEQSYVPKNKIPHQGPSSCALSKPSVVLQGNGDNSTLFYLILRPPQACGWPHGGKKFCWSEGNAVERWKSGTPPTTTNPDGTLSSGDQLKGLLCGQGCPCPLPPPHDEVTHGRLRFLEKGPWFVSTNFRQHKAQPISAQL